MTAMPIPAKAKPITISAAQNIQPPLVTPEAISPTGPRYNVISKMVLNTMLPLAFFEIPFSLK